MSLLDQIGALVVPQTLLTRLQETAIAAARAAGELQLRLFRKEHLIRAMYDHDLTLEVDKQCEQAMVDIIRKAFPRHGIVSEEGGSQRSDEPWLWVLDPLDGTVNYYHGIPFFCACVSCHQRSDAMGAQGLSSVLGTVAAGVFAPALDEMYAAARGRGATLNGHALVCSGIRDLGSSVIGVSLGSRSRDTDAMLRLCRSLSGRARKLRSFGATGYDLAQVAACRLGGIAQKGVNLWDVAAGALLVEEAGGVVEGRPTELGRWDLIAAAGSVHPELSALVHEAWKASA